jgi:hypothetical protein
MEKYFDPSRRTLQNRLEFENRGHFAPGWNLARHNYKGIGSIDEASNFSCRLSR